MHKYYLISVILLIGNFLLAQTDPGTGNLKHQWTFDNGTTTDNIGSANGTLMNGATISNNSLNTTFGGYMVLPAKSIKINTYNELTTEVWFKSSTGQNAGNSMLIYFGDIDVDGWKGTNYIFTSPSNGGKCRLAISTGSITEPWKSEDGVNNPLGAIDDGQLHQLISVIDNTTISFYIDGEKVGSTPLTDSNGLTSVSESNAFLCKSGYSDDPTWRGFVNKFSIYNKALSEDEILFLFQQGAESSTSIDVSISSLSFDEINTSTSILVSGINLKSNISISAPSGINVNPAILDSNVINATVNITYDGSSEINDKITLSSGDIVIDLPVKANVNAACFTPLYEGIPNLISDPYMNTMENSWGNASVVTGKEVYCGSSCVRIAGTELCWPNGGSVSTNNINWLPNTTYRFRAKIKTMDGTFTMGVQNANVDGGSGDYNISVPYTLGLWDDFDATFTTGSSPGTGVAFFNNCGSANGLVAYIDNWELYEVPGISTSVNIINLDEYTTTASFTVTGVNLADPIILSATEGITLDVNKLQAGASNVRVNLQANVQNITSGTVLLQSGSISKTIIVEVYNNDCYSPLFNDTLNLIENPWMNDLTGFDGWGTKSINTDPTNSYCGVSCGEITVNGAIVKDLTGSMKPKTPYRLKAKVFRKKLGNITYTLDLDPTTYPTQYNLIKTAMDSACSIYNEYFPIDVDIYVYYNTGIPTAQASYYGSIGFGASQAYMWVGTAMHEIDHYLGSGTATEWRSLAVGGKWTGVYGNAVSQEISGTDISSDGTHFWPHGINYRSEIENLGGQAEQLAGLIANAKVAKAMIVDDAGLGTNKAPVGIGVFGWNANKEDIYHEITATDTWIDVEFTFTTGDTLGQTQGVIFNSGPGYIDNWELYNLNDTAAIIKDTTNVNDTVVSIKDRLSLETYNVFTSVNEIVTEITLDKSDEIYISIYNINGIPINRKRFPAKKGYNKLIIQHTDLHGLYIVQIVSNKATYSNKIIIN